MKTPHLHPIPTYDDTEIRSISLASRHIEQNTPTLFRAKGKILHTKKEYYCKPKELAFRKRKAKSRYKYNNTRCDKHQKEKRERLLSERSLFIFT